MENIFDDCSVIFLPDISKWNLINVKNKKSIINSFSENIIENSKSLSLSFHNYSSNKYSNNSSNNSSNGSCKENKKISYENYDIIDIDFNPKSNKILDYYENFYK